MNTTRKRDELLDAALEMTFPASDPIAVDPPVRRRRTAARGASPQKRKSGPPPEPGSASTAGTPRG
ncbi:MAG: hypothetical protein N3D71_03640 [Burkholderiaceae bacterium]|nr:hypothetical protein [Burkholderiaceae bacterium]